MSNLDRRPAARELGGLEAHRRRAGAGPAAGQGGAARREHPGPPAAAHAGPADGRRVGVRRPLRPGRRRRRRPACRWRPHPHTGLQTVSWLLEGEVHHRDSLGSDVEFGPGELALMTAGHGIAHAEQSPVGASAVPARRAAVGGAARRPPRGGARVRAPRDAARLHLRRADGDGAHGLLRRGHLPGDRLHPAGRRRPGRWRPAPTSSCRWSRTSSTGCWPRRRGDGRGRPAGARRDALPRHRPRGRCG